MQPQFNCGITNITGIGLSPEMITIAKSLNHHIAFDIADMLNSKYADSSIGAVVAFYAVVHFNYDGLKKRLKKCTVC